MQFLGLLECGFRNNRFKEIGHKRTGADLIQIENSIALFTTNQAEQLIVSVYPLMIALCLQFCCLPPSIRTLFFQNNYISPDISLANNLKNPS